MTDNDLGDVSVFGNERTSTPPSVARKRDRAGRFVRICSGCGIFEADPPHHFCDGCKAHAERWQ